MRDLEEKKVNGYGRFLKLNKCDHWNCCWLGHHFWTYCGCAQKASDRSKNNRISTASRTNRNSGAVECSRTHLENLDGHSSWHRVCCYVYGCTRLWIPSRKLCKGKVGKESL